MPSDDIDTLMDRISSEGVLPERRLSRLRAAIDDQTPPHKLLEKLTSLNWITEWQAGELKAGSRRLSFAGVTLLEPIGHAQGTRAYLARRESPPQLCRIDIPLQQRALSENDRQRWLEVIGRLQSTGHPFLVATTDLLTDGASGEWGVLSRPLSGDWHGFSKASIVPTDTAIETDQLAVSRPTREQRVRVATITRQLAVIWAHAHAHDLFDPELRPEQIQIDDAGSVRVLHFGLSSLYEVDSKWRRPAGEMAPSDNQQRIQYDLERLGQLGMFLLTGSPQGMEGKNHATRLERVFRWLLAASEEGRIQSMASAAKAIERWERSNRGRADSESQTALRSDQFMRELNQASHDQANREGQTRQASFQLGPAVDLPSPKETPEAETSGQRNANGLWIALGIVIVIALGIGGVALLNFVAS